MPKYTLCLLLSFTASHCLVFICLSMFLLFLLFFFFCWLFLLIFLILLFGLYLEFLVLWRVFVKYWRKGHYFDSFSFWFWILWLIRLLLLLMNCFFFCFRLWLCKVFWLNNDFFLLYIYLFLFLTFFWLFDIRFQDRIDLFWLNAQILLRTDESMFAFTQKRILLSIFLKIWLLILLVLPFLISRAVIRCQHIINVLHWFFKNFWIIGCKFILGLCDFSVV